jgi:abhydrolase domain-containing protein 17
MRILLILVGVGYLSLIVLAMFADRLIFLPHPSSYRDSDFTVTRMTDIQHVKIPSGNATISAVYLANPSATYTVIYSHGNGEDIGDDLPILESLRDAGFAVFAYDYRGYGTSTGSPSEQGVYEDAHAAYEYVTQTLHVPASHVIAFGHSLGAAAAIELAASRPVAGLIADAPFLSAFRVLTRVQILPWDKFNNAARIRQVKCPVLVIQGKADGVIPWWHGQRIYELANQPKRFLWIDGAGHNDALVVAERQYLQAVSEFATSIQLTSSRASR